MLAKELKMNPKLSINQELIYADALQLYAKKGGLTFTYPFNGVVLD
jgi:hypothetical protein